MNVSRLLAVAAGLGAATVTVLYVVIMARQDDLFRDTFRVSLITATFASSAATLLVGAWMRRLEPRVALLSWGATVALFWTLLLNTLTPLWLPIAVLGWIAAIRAIRSLNREAEGNDGWVILGGTWAVCVTVLAIVVAGTIVSHRSPESGTQGARRSALARLSPQQVRRHLQVPDVDRAVPDRGGEAAPSWHRVRDAFAEARLRGPTSLRRACLKAGVSCRRSYSMSCRLRRNQTTA